jgi:hypothetical protein
MNFWKWNIIWKKYSLSIEKELEYGLNETFEREFNPNNTGNIINVTNF